METFKINKELEVICQYKKTRNGFKHTASLMRSGLNIDEVKINYQNRTWERYTYESVLQKLLGKTNTLFLTPKEVKQFEKTIENGIEHDRAELKSVGMLMQLGEIIGENQKESNDWKARMLQAGLGDSGLIMPEDWDTLDEDAKTARMDEVIKILAQ